MPTGWTIFDGWDQETRDFIRTRMQAAVDAMTSPVECAHCHRFYDLGTVEVTARYTDCSMWKAPCCGVQVDDRGEFWKSRPDYRELRRSGATTRPMEGDPT